jgi:hypothetical protein
MMDVDEALARMEIQAVLWRYARGADRFDYDAMASAYHPDAMDEHGSFSGLGRDFARRHTERPVGEDEVDQMHITNIVVEMDGSDDARVESYFLSFHSHQDDRPKFAIAAGRYLDHFQRRTGAWKIAARRVVMDWTRDHLDGPPWARADGRPVQGRPMAFGDPSCEFFGGRP